MLPGRFGVRHNGYVLMPNHYHLQVETPEANLSQAIHWLNVGYSVWLNRKYGRVGPLFQGRFKAVLHEPEEALVINRYIHLNPVRIKAAGGHEGRTSSDVEITKELARRRVEILEQFPWSSYGYFAGTKAPVDWLSTDSILECFGQGSERKRRQAFRRELREAAGTGGWETEWKMSLRDPGVVWGAGVVAQMRKLIPGDPD